MSMTPEQRKVAAFNKFFAEHIEELRENYEDPNIDPMNEFFELAENNSIELNDKEMMNISQVLFELLDDKNRANSFSFEGGRGGDPISFDLHDWLVENEEGFLYDEYTYIYFDEGSELYVCYMRSDSFIHIEIGISEYVKHFIIELR